MALSLQQKKAQVAEVKEAAQSAQSAVAAEYRGLTVGQMTELRAQARSAGVFQTVEHPTAGPFETIAPPVHLSAHPMRGDRPAPALGAESEQILREAGLSPDEVKAILG